MAEWKPPVWGWKPPVWGWAGYLTEKAHPVNIEGLEVVAEWPVNEPASAATRRNEYASLVAGLVMKMPALNTIITSCPGCQRLGRGATWGHTGVRVMDVIIALNDQHMWSREAIADWVETLDLDLTLPLIPDPIEGSVTEGEPHGNTDAGHPGG